MTHILLAYFIVAYFTVVMLGYCLTRWRFYIHEVRFRQFRLRLPFDRVPFDLIATVIGVTLYLTLGHYLGVWGGLFAAMAAGGAATTLCSMGAKAGAKAGNMQAVIMPRQLPTDVSMYFTMFFQQLTQEEGEKLFGPAVKGKPVGGIFTFKQLEIISSVARLQESSAVLAALLPGSPHEITAWQLQQAEQVVGQRLMPFLDIMARMEAGAHEPPLGHIPDGVPLSKEDIAKLGRSAGCLDCGAQTDDMYSKPLVHKDGCPSRPGAFPNV